MAFCVGSTTLLRPVETHPTQVGLGRPVWRIDGIFGWTMM